MKTKEIKNRNDEEERKIVNSKRVTFTIDSGGSGEDMHPVLHCRLPRVASSPLTITFPVL